MLKKIDNRQLSAAANISSHPQWLDFRGYLELELSACYDAILETDSESALHELRGRAKALKGIVKLVDTSRDVLNKQTI